MLPSLGLSFPVHKAPLWLPDPRHPVFHILSPRPRQGPGEKQDPQSAASPEARVLPLEAAVPALKIHVEFYMEKSFC